MGKFSKGDKVLQNGTTIPVMTVMGVTTKPGSINTNNIREIMQPVEPITYTCEWGDFGSTGEFEEFNLTLIEKNRNV